MPFLIIKMRPPLTHLEENISMTLNRIINFNISYFEQKDQSVTKFTKHSFRDGCGGGW